MSKRKQRNKKGNIEASAEMLPADVLIPAFAPVDQKAYSLSDTEFLAIVNAFPTAAGQSVNPTTAMSVPAVRAAVMLLATSVGSLPFKLYERDEDGDGKSVKRDHPAYKLVHDEASDECSAEEFRTQLTADAILHTYGYAFINRDHDGKPTELLRLDPTRVSTKQTATGSTFYEVQTDAGRITYAFNQILRLTVPGGVSPLVHGRETIALAIALDRAAARIFAKAGRPSGAITIEKHLGEDGLARLKTGWKAAHSGENSGGTAILEDGAKFNQFVWSSVDAEFAAMRAFSVVDIARVFNVPATMLQALENGTFANVEQQALAFRVFSLGPWLTAWSRSYERALLAPSERAHLFVEAVTDGLLAADTAARTAQIRELRASGVITANEARSLINFPARPDGNSLSSPYTTAGNASTPAPEKAAA